MATSTSAATSLANANASASATTLTGSVTANVSVPDINGFASSEGQVTVSGMFQINAPASSVDVTVDASLLASQFLNLNEAGLSASSEVTFAVAPPDLSASPVLFFDNLMTAGPGETMSNDESPSLSISLSDVPTETPLSFVASLDAESPPISLRQDVQRSLRDASMLLRSLQSGLALPRCSR